MVVQYVYGDKVTCTCGVNETCRKLEFNGVEIPICAKCLIHLGGETTEEIKRL